MVRRNYPVAIATRFGAPVEEEASVVGCLCTPLDRLADKAGFPRAEVGDLVAVFCAGAYGASASPPQILGQGGHALDDEGPALASARLEESDRILDDLDSTETRHV